MALKGKKKSRSRGSQARRKPAAAPRPAYGAKSKPPWYKTTAGMVIGFVVLASLAIFLLWFTADRRSDNQALETQKEELETFTGELRGVVQNLTPVATELSTAGELSDADLEKGVASWKNQLSEAQTTIAQLAAPSGLEVVNGLLTQSILLYVQSAEQYELLPSLEGETREQVAGKAGASFSSANSIFASVIELLDAKRADADMNGSGLRTPGTGAPPSGEMVPGTDSEVPAEEGDE